MKTVTHQEFIIDPSFCPIDYTWISSGTYDDDFNTVTAVSGYANYDFSIYYAKDLTPAEFAAYFVVDTVTLTGTSTSKHGTVNT